jgi:hypothetical protein
MPFQNPMNAPAGGLPGLWFNPFLASVAGRAGEHFDPSVAPQGVSQGDIASAQAGQHAQQGGNPGGNPNVSNTDTAGQAAVGAPAPMPGVPTAGTGGFDPSNFFTNPFGIPPLQFPGMGNPANNNILNRGGVF